MEAFNRLLAQALFDAGSVFFLGEGPHFVELPNLLKEAPTKSVFTSGEPEFPGWAARKGAS